MGRIGNVIAQPVHIAAPLYAPGTILQVESSTKIDTQTTTSTSQVDISGLGVTIHPKFSTSKILVTYSLTVGGHGHNFFRLKRIQDGSTTYIGRGDSPGDLKGTTSYFFNENTAVRKKVTYSYSFEFLDVANSVSPISYQLEMWTRDSSYVIHVNRALNEDSASYYGRSSSSITAKEVCQ